MEPEPEQSRGQRRVSEMFDILDALVAYADRIEHVFSAVLSEAVTINERLNKIMSEQSNQQAELDADTQAILEENATLTSALSAFAQQFTVISQELQTLQAARTAGQPLDLSGLESAIAQGATLASSVTSTETQFAGLDPASATTGS